MTHAPKNIQDSYKEIIPGVYQYVPNEVYHSSDGISKSNIVDISKSISTYLHRKKFPLKQTDSMLKGSALHDLVLLPDVFKKNYVVCPFKKDARTKKYKDFLEEHPDKDILTVGMSDDVHAMRDALYKNPTIKEILDSKTLLREVSIWSKDIDTGLLLKVRPDLLANGVIWDLKTTISPTPIGFLHSVWDYKYQVQSAYYQDVCRMNEMQITDFGFITIGSKPPYLTAVYNLTDELVQEGREYYKKALKTYADYLMSDDMWDGLTEGRSVVTLG